MTCELCDWTDVGTGIRTIRSGLACYADDGRFERIDRCTNHGYARVALPNTVAAIGAFVLLVLRSVAFHRFAR